MASLPIYDLAGSSAGTFEIDSEFDADSINKQLMHDVVVMYQANARQGSHHARTRGEVSGTNKKMYRQKGTGNARAGSKRTNVRRGGGVARTIKPRDYSYRLPKKAVRLATRMAIASKINDHQACVIDGLALDAPRTKPVASFLAAIGLAGESVLIVTGQHDPVVYRSARNIEGVEVQEVRQLNALGLLRPKMVVFTKDAIQRVKDGTFADATDSVSAG